MAKSLAQFLMELSEDAWVKRAGRRRLRKKLKEEGHLLDPRHKKMLEDRDRAAVERELQGAPAPGAPPPGAPPPGAPPPPPPPGAQPQANILCILF